MILRIEDTDEVRSKKEYVEDIIKGLAWLGIIYDEIFYQSKRTDLYEKYIKRLIEGGHAYVSKEEKDGVGNEVIRFRNPGKKISFHDDIRGDIEFDTEELGDFVIARSMKSPLYHLVVVVDDHEMGVTHIVRGEDHISNTPRQILIQEAIGAPRPNYAHIPLVLAPDRSKLSKRKGAKSIKEYRKEGYLPQALINFLALLGWSPQSVDENLGEVLSLEELVTHFSVEHIQKSGAVFNVDKLKWLNKEHLKRLSAESAYNEVKIFLPEKIKDMPQYSEERLKKLIPVIIERIETLGELKGLYEKGELHYFFERPYYGARDISWKEETKENTLKYIREIVNRLEQYIWTSVSPEDIKAELWTYAEENGKGNVLWPMRYALSGQEKSPDPFTLASILGKEETIFRLKGAIEKLEEEKVK